MGEFLFGVFRAVPAAQGSHKSNDLPSKFQPAIDKGRIEQLGNEGVGRDEDVGTRSKRMDGQLAPIKEESGQAVCAHSDSRR